MYHVECIYKLVIKKYKFKIQIIHPCYLIDATSKYKLDILEHIHHNELHIFFCLFSFIHLFTTDMINKQTDLDLSEDCGCLYLACEDNLDGVD
jgi:hypothetical protein